MELQELQKKIGNEVKKLRLMNNWTQEEVAEKLHICRKAYGEIERGETDIHLSRLLQVATFFGLDINYFVDGKEKNIVYVTGTQNDHNKNLCHEYHIHSAEEKDLQQALEKALLTVEFNQKENNLLKQKIEDLQKIIQLLEDKPSVNSYNKQG
jgi:transcriptional regulator with XRE-family HTH domain